MKKIIVLGAGPAGVSCAIGLKSLNYEVLLISKRRPFEAIEGFSHRTIEGLQRAKCFNALAAIKEQVPRVVTWNNKKTKQNFEFVVNRKEFDEALIKDAKEHKIKVIEKAGRISNINNITIIVDKKEIKADFIVDARGRFCPRKTSNKSKSTIAHIVKSNYLKNHKTQTTLYTQKKAWIWEAKIENELNYLQVVTDENEKEYLKKILEINGFNQDTKVYKRDASSYLSKDFISSNYLKIGDAACSVDPLSGNGVFQALSTALISPYVVHTLLEGKEEDKTAAKEFFSQRVNDIFYRYARMGREFYSNELQFNTSFWIDRGKWPDKIDSHNTDEDFEVYIEKKAILIAPFIKANEVVITKDQPMGIWRMGRINLVNIVKELFKFSYEKRKKELQNLSDELLLSIEETKFLFNWCLENKLIK